MCTSSATTCHTFETEDVCENATTSPDRCNVNGVCQKCGTQDTRVSLRNKNEYCDACLLNITRHKFRATLGKSKLVRPNDSILVAHSGKPNSTTLVHLIANSIDGCKSKKLLLRCKVLYVDDGAIKGRTMEERCSLRNALAEESLNLGLAAYVISLSKSISDVTSMGVEPLNEAQIPAAEDEDELRQIFNSLKTDTSKDELLRQLRRKLFVSVARKLNCDKIFVADTSVDLAVKVLGDVSTGRGSQLSYTVAFLDPRQSDVTLLRPLKDFTADDVSGYLRCYKLSPVVVPLKRNVHYPTSIRNITKDFVERLNSEFHGTVSTIYRTSEKLTTRSVAGIRARTDGNTELDESNICVMCELPVDTCRSPGERISVEQAKAFSESVSTAIDLPLNATTSSIDVCEWPKDNNVHSPNACVEVGQCRCRSSRSCDADKPKQIDIRKEFCYSCRLIVFDSRQNGDILSVAFCNAIEKKLQIAQMRKEIADFLL